MNEQRYDLNNLFDPSLNIPESIGAPLFSDITKESLDFPDENLSLQNTFKDGAGSTINNNQLINNVSVEDGYLQSGNFVSGSAGWKLTPTSAELNVSTALLALDIPDTTTANSFHVNSTGDAWWGAAAIGSALAKILKTGVATFTDIIATGHFEGTFVPNRHYFYSGFESFTGWNLNTAGITGSNMNARISTGAVINTERILGFDGVSVIANFDKNSEFSTGMNLPAIADTTVYLNIGGNNVGAGDKYYGFKIINGTISAIHSNGSVETATELSGITLPGTNIYKVIYTAGTKIEFYVNGILKATHTSNLPSGSMDPVIYITIENTAAADKIMNVSFVAFAQDV